MAKSGITKTTRRKEIWSKTNGRCAHCGKLVPASQQTVDHFIPKADGGGYDRRNLMPLCYDCNKERGDEIIDPKDFYAYAPEWVIAECFSYKNEWRQSRKNANGEIIV